MANVTIVREGYAQPFTKSPNVRYAALFRRCGAGGARTGAGVAAAAMNTAVSGLGALPFGPFPANGPRTRGAAKRSSQ